MVELDDNGGGLVGIGQQNRPSFEVRSVHLCGLWRILVSVVVIQRRDLPGPWHTAGGTHCPTNFPALTTKRVCVRSPSERCSPGDTLEAPHQTSRQLTRSSNRRFDPPQTTWTTAIQTLFGYLVGFTIMLAATCAIPLWIKRQVKSMVRNV